jgi:hypothetical protein
MLQLLVRTVVGLLNGSAEKALTDISSSEGRADTAGVQWTRDYKQEPARDGAAVTPSDGADLPGGPCRSIYVGGAGSGNLKITTLAGNPLVLAGVPVGVLPIQASRIWSTGTDVTNLVALY